MNETKFRPRVLWVSPEAAPYASTGGLAEVAGAMPRRLHAAGWPVALLMPCYTERCSVADAPEIVGSTPLEVELAGRTFQTEIVQARAPGGLPLRMLRYAEFFGRRGIYAQDDHDYPDNHLRFALLQSKLVCDGLVVDAVQRRCFLKDGSRLFVEIEHAMTRDNLSQLLLCVVEPSVDIFETSG